MFFTLLILLTEQSYPWLSKQRAKLVCAFLAFLIAKVRRTFKSTFINRTYRMFYASLWLAFIICLYH